MTTPLLARNVGSDIHFELNDKHELSVTIDTERLHIRSVEPTKAEYSVYSQLCGDPDVMAMLGAGKTLNETTVQSYINCWVKRWHSDIPYSGLAVLNSDTDDFVGHVGLVQEGKPGEAVLSYLFMKRSWKQGFGTEAVAAVVNDYVPETIRRGYKIGGKPLTRLNATVHYKNKASEKILQKTGMFYLSSVEKHGAWRHCYMLDTTEFAPKRKKCPKCVVL